jgi:hypothetical protein
MRFSKGRPVRHDAQLFPNETKEALRSHQPLNYFKENAQAEQCGATRLKSSVILGRKLGAESAQF